MELKRPKLPSFKLPNITLSPKVKKFLLAVTLMSPFLTICLIGIISLVGLIMLLKILGGVVIALAIIFAFAMGVEILSENTDS